MRVIKFRAWQDNQMLTQKTSGIYTTKQFLDKLYEDCELMQFTGLKDKNGKEIYEGDIVNADWLDGDEIQDKLKPYEVFFDTGFMIKLESCDYYSHTLDTESMYLEVIGNIYSNPELMEAKNDKQTNRRSDKEVQREV